MRPRALVFVSRSFAVVCRHAGQRGRRPARIGRDQSMQTHKVLYLGSHLWTMAFGWVNFSTFGQWHLDPNTPSCAIFGFSFVARLFVARVAICGLVLQSFIKSSFNFLLFRWMRVHRCNWYGQVRYILQWLYENFRKFRWRTTSSLLQLSLKRIFFNLRTFYIYAHSTQKSSQW